MQDASKHVHDDTLQDIADFVAEAHEESTGDAVLPLKEVPAALVFAGINVTDHLQFYESLAVTLRTSVAIEHHCYVAVLRSATCTSLKAAMKSLMEQLMRSDAAAGDVKVCVRVCLQ